MEVKMSIEDHTKKVMDSLKEGETLINRVKNPSQDMKKEEKMATNEGFDPGKYNKAWVAGIITFFSQWNINLNDAVNQVVANPPENMLQGILTAVICGGAVWWVKNRGES